MSQSKTEASIWTRSPSQVVNLPIFSVLTLLIWTVLPIFVMIWKWLVVKNTSYELTTERLKTKSGVLNKDTDELELYRVRDYHLSEPLLYRLFGLGNIVLESSDRSHPTFTIEGIPDAESFMTSLRERVEACRKAKGVREVDIDGGLAG